MPAFLSSHTACTVVFTLANKTMMTMSVDGEVSNVLYWKFACQLEIIVKCMVCEIKSIV